MPEERTNWTLWIILGAIVALLVSCAAGALAGGLAGYYAGRSAARNVVPDVSPFEMPPPFPLDQDQDRAPNVPMPEFMPMRGGALIVEVTEGSPAERAGIEVGDVVVAVNGRGLDAEYTLAQAVNQYDPGDTIQVTIARSGRERAVDVELGRHPERGGETPWLGVAYRSLGEMQIRPQQTPQRFQFQFPGQGNS